MRLCSYLYVEVEEVVPQLCSTESPYNQIQLGGSKEERGAATPYKASTTPLASSVVWRVWNSRNEHNLKIEHGRREGDS